MELQSEFTEFLQNIRLTSNQRKDLITGHNTLRSRLLDDGELKDFIVADFLQGSYRRSTAVKPKADRRADVDVVVVTNLSEQDYTPQAAMDKFKPLLERYYKGKWQFQGRSIGIELSYVDLDLVVTSIPTNQEITLYKSAAVTSSDDLEQAPDWTLNPLWLSLEDRQFRSDARQLMTEAISKGDWKTGPLRIPDRKASVWQDTHPLEQLRWTREKNKLTNGHFVNVVKALKWWRLVNYETPEHPRGYPHERLIGEVCPNGIESVAEGIVASLEKISSEYSWSAQSNQKPTLPDYGVSNHDVFGRVTVSDFRDYYAQAVTAAKLARRAYDSTDSKESSKYWRELLGNEFPEVQSSKSGSFVTPSAPAKPNQGRFA